VLSALAKLVLAAAAGAATMALLGHAASGRLGSFGDVGVDQDTFGIAVFVWFVAVGLVTVVMSGGIVLPRRRRPEPEPEPETGPPDELDEDGAEGAATREPAGDEPPPRAPPDDEESAPARRAADAEPGEPAD
jgi:hypothetical protein